MSGSSFTKPNKILLHNQISRFDSLLIQAANRNNFESKAVNYKADYQLKLRQQVAIAEVFVETKAQHLAFEVALSDYAKDYVQVLVKAILTETNDDNDKFERWCKNNRVAVRTAVLRARTSKQILDDSKSTNFERELKDSVSAFAYCLSELQTTLSNPAPIRQKTAKMLLKIEDICGKSKAKKHVARTLFLLGIDKGMLINLAGTRSMLWSALMSLDEPTNTNSQLPRPERLQCNR